MDDYEQTDVLICGCGPTGAILSGYLGKMSIHNIVLEKEPDITTDPRGIALDDDGIRALQGLGLYEHVFADIGSTIPRVRFVSGIHQDLHKTPFLSFDTSSSEGNTGHIGAMRQKQPALEKHLRSVIEGSKFSMLRSSCALTSIDEDNNWVYTSYRDPAGAEKKLRAKFLVAADGKTGYTRKHYLEPKGIQLEWAERTKYDETWVALNWKIQLPTPESHPEFPLWELGYSPETVYDLFFPDDFRFLCNSRRPAVCGRFGLPEDRLWRFEFVVGSEEDGVEMAKRDKIKEVVGPYITHPGSRYGRSDVLNKSACRVLLSFRKTASKFFAQGPFDSRPEAVTNGPSVEPFCVEMQRTFSRHTVFIAIAVGGQGIASGFRDAIGLAWRLSILCSSNQRLDHSAILTGWYQERKQQLDKSLAATVRNGDMVNTKNVLQGLIRDWALWSMQCIPSWKHWLELGPRAEGPVQYAHEPGLPFLPGMSGGGCFAQTYCVAVSDKESRAFFTDDAIFASSKICPFQVVILLPHLEALMPTLGELEGIEQVAPQLLRFSEATIFVPRKSVPPGAEAPNSRLYRSATAEEFGKSSLCNGRPFPRGYNEDLMWQSMSGKRYVILRPDRFVFAACKTVADLGVAARRLEAMFSV
ncbi:monooxygenase [Penicillium waksmanii]|uniref:monooxygenase n=1 Tax=Penicillium waksmanii TaxID=69791 RepID=UPI002546AF25|nr:monooxygenase [Penicillium waksmanii]KAJ5974815.1 monooxygenase [Penicillium waksmanii]